MKFVIRPNLFLVLLLLLSVSVKAKTFQGDSHTASPSWFIDKANSIRYQNPDSAIVLLQRGYEQSINNKDTLNAIYSLTEMCEIHAHHARYKESYDGYWKALQLADESNNDVAKASIYINIGRLYSFYKREGEALKYFDISLQINKQLVAEQVIAETELLMNYYAIAATYRELNDPLMAKAYLDSCLFVYAPASGQQMKPYIKFELAYVKAQKGQYTEALKSLHDIHPWFKENKPSYLVLVYTYTGDIYKKLANYAKSEEFYKKALAVSSQYHSHIDFTPIVHEKLSDIYSLTKDYSLAYNSLKAAKDLDALFFDSRSKNNLPLLEIQDAFRLEQERQNELIRKQRLAQLEHDDKVWFLQKIILIVTIVSIILISILYFRYERSRHKAEKQLIKKKQDLEIQKANEVLEIKNKELIASAVQVIERDELLSELKCKLVQQKQAPNPQALGKLVKSIDLSTSRDWEEFETRFTSVNERFYESLSKKFPKLSQHDHKLCALIKLNLSSKDMARLLGISIESVHTNRYRLRKKLALERSTNLEDFIARV